MRNLESTDSRNKLEDLSGVVVKPGDNPYEVFIEACNNNHVQIRELYAAHRLNRNEQQRQKFVSPDFKDLIIDPYLLRIEDQSIEPGFKDERNCFTFWARPPEHVLSLAFELQQRLKAAAPNIWLMPLHRMHMTTLELAFSKTAGEMRHLTDRARPSIPKIVSYTYSHRSRLVKPLISYDLSAFAVSFLPAAGESVLSPSPSEPQTTQKVVSGDAYTYHHLRRDIFNMTKDSGIEIGSRYQVPSAHITLGRYLTRKDHDTAQKRENWVKAIDEINQWLMDEVWDKPEAKFIGEWIVGQERGLDARNGALWYGGGRTILLGEGF